MRFTQIVTLTSCKKEIVRRSLAGCLTLLLTLAMTVPTWAVVFTNPATITINDATTIGTFSPYSSDIIVAGLVGTISNVVVRVNNLNHTFPDDIDILLVGPAGTNIILLSDCGGSDDVTNRTITFDDAAATLLPDATTLNSGTFKPTNIGAGDTFNAPAPAPSSQTTLGNTFIGTAPNGTWSLYVVDDLGADLGVIGNGWDLSITIGASTTTFSNGAPILGGDGARGRATPYASTITSSGLTGAITDVNVTLNNINHLNPDDIDIVLVGPSGKRIMLLSDAGGAADVINTTVTFDDAAAAAIPDAGPLVAGTFKPANYGSGDTMLDLLPPYSNSTTAGSATLASVFNGTNPNGTWKLYIVDDATTSAGNVLDGWSVDITAGGVFGAKRFTSSDFDGDGKTDVSIFRQSDRNWYFRDSATYANRVFPAFGDAGDVLVPADYDGDGKTDVAVFRPSQGRWYIVQSTTSTLRQVAWGTSGDKPVPADYDGDGLIDLAVWRSGVWYVLQSMTSTGRVVSWGFAGDMPLRGHFNGTNGADFAVFRPSENNWYILNNAGSSSRVVNFGASGDTIGSGDFDGDGKSDPAVFRGSTGDGYAFLSTTSTAVGIHWGATGDVPVPGDYDGDSIIDTAVWRPSTGSWYLANTGTADASGIRADNWGQSGDVAIPFTYLPQ